MFQFSGDFDEEAEDFLSIPLDGKWNENNKKYVNRNENFNTSKADSITEKDPVFESLDDEDEESENFLNISLDGKWNKNDKNHNSEKQNANTSEVDWLTEKDPVFENLDDEDETTLLSVVENFDSTFSPSAQNSILDDSFSSNSRARTSGESGSSNTFTLTNKCGRERLDSVDFKRSASYSQDTSRNTSKLVTTGDVKLPLTFPFSKLEYERKFPGPAGLRLKKSRDSLTDTELNKSGFRQQANVHITDDILTTNMNWLELMKEVNAKSGLSKILNEFAVVALRRLNSTMQISRKIPVFAAVISHIDAKTSDPSVILKDATGEIRGSLTIDVWEEYGHLLIVGSALLLRRVSMLSFSKMLCMNITTKNIDTIYSYHSDDGSVLITRVTSFAILDSLCEKSNSTAGTQVENAHSEAPIILTNSKSANVSVSSVSFIDHELEGIDVNSLLEDF